MMYLSKLDLDARVKEVRRDLSDVHQLHRSVMSMFPEVPGETPRVDLGVLYRLEPGDKAVLLVQSSAPAERQPAGFTIAGSRPLEPLLDALQPGQRVRYRVVANATRSTFERGTRGKLKALTGQDASEWWQRRAAVCGLQLGADHTAETVGLTGRRGENQVTVIGTRFDGIATVLDADSLRTAVREGIGRAKAYGCGLLSLALQ